MATTRKPRRTNPTIFVFCEGETEQRYIDLLRQKLRVPIQIITKVLNTRISARAIETHIKNCGYPGVDKVFLFYDGDRLDIVERLNSISGSELMLSCPCVELWFLLHFTDCHAALDSNNMVKALLRQFPEYKKGEIQGKLREVLIENWKIAATRAKKRSPQSNPSTTAYILLEYIEQIKNQ